MINRCCSKSIDFLIDNGTLNSEDKELYMYSMRVLVCGLINAITALAIGMVMGMLKQSVCLFVTFFIIRKFAGGMHADKYKNCFVSSIFINVLALGGIYLFKRFNNVALFCIILFISLITIIIFSPIENTNKPLSANEKCIYKILSIFFSILITVCSIIFLIDKVIIGISIGMGQILVSILLFIKVLYERVKSISI